MNEYSDEDFVDDVLDIIPAALPPFLVAKVYREALSRYRKVLDVKMQSEDLLSTFVVINHSETYFVRRRWGEDSLLDGGQLPARTYYWNKFKQIASAGLGPARGYNFVESALQDILSHHGCEGAIGFISRAWTEKMIICHDHAWLPWWLLARCIVFDIDYSESQSEHLQALRSTSLQTPDNSAVSMYQVAQEIAKIDSVKKRDCDGLIEYYWVVRKSSESSLAQVRKVNTYSSWIKGIRNLLPSYAMLNILADEALFCANTEDRGNFASLSRFVDERKTDISISLAHPFWDIAYLDIASGSDKRSQIRRAKFYSKGRVVFPTFVFEKLIDMVHANHIDLSSLNNSIRDSIRPGHRWFLNHFEKWEKKMETDVGVSYNVTLEELGKLLANPPSYEPF